MGVPAERALGDAISALTTGLVHPQGIMRAPLDTGPSIILGVGLFAGAMGLALWLPLRDGKPFKAISDPEVSLFVGLLIVFICFALASDLNVTEGLSWALSALSTSGLSLSDPADYNRIPLPVLVLPALIGGSALSAAGGVKLARFIVLARRAGQEFRQLGYRRSILRFTFRDRELNERSVIGVWVYLIGYILADFPHHGGLFVHGRGICAINSPRHRKPDELCGCPRELPHGSVWTCAGFNHFYHDFRAFGGSGPDSSAFPQLLAGLTVVRTCTCAVIPLARHITRTGQIGFPSCPPTKNRTCKILFSTPSANHVRL